MNTREYSELQKLYLNIINEYDEAKSAASAEKNLVHSFNRPGHQAPGYKYSGRLAPDRNNPKNQVPDQKRISQDLKAATQRSQQRQLQMNSYDPFEIVKNHLLDEGYASDERSAFAIMASMSKDWTKSILEAEVLAKKGGVEGIGTGANWKAKSWTSAEKSRFSSYKKPTTPDTNSSSASPKASAPAAPAAAPRPQTTPSDVALQRLKDIKDRRDFEMRAMAAGTSPVGLLRKQAAQDQESKFDAYQKKQRESGYYKTGYKNLAGTFGKG